jgi:hypothetical protein
LRDNFGKKVASFTNEMKALDDKTIVIRLKRAFPLLAAALGKGGAP